MPATWQALADVLSPAELTVVAQEVPPNDQGQLLWDTFMPRMDVDSVELNTVTTLDYRPTADRREWNARGRAIPLATPTRRKVTINPIESYHTIQEQELQRLRETNRGANDAEVARIVGTSLPDRVRLLTEANYRRIEFDTFKAWSTGTIVQRNPENAAQAYTASFGFSSSRYTTAGTAWNDGSVNAYDLLLSWLASAEDLVGSVEGVLLRLATMNAILADAPNLPNSVKMTRSELADRITQDKGTAFQFFVVENSIDIFDDGGTTYTRTKIWPAQTIAAVPTGRRVGSVAFAPVTRAMDAAAELPEAGVDVNGMSAYYDQAALGRQLTIECQVNAAPIPDETKMYVTQVGV